MAGASKEEGGLEPLIILTFVAPSESAVSSYLDNQLLNQLPKVGFPHEQENKGFMWLAAPPAPGETNC